MNGQRPRVYEVRERGTYRQFWIPRRSVTNEEAVAKDLRNIVPVFIDYGTDVRKIFPAEMRSYFAMQNLDPGFELWLGLGHEPNVAAKLGVLIPSEQMFEPLRIPQNEIFVVGSGAGKAILLYSLD